MDTNLVVSINQVNCIVYIDYYYCSKSQSRDSYRYVPIVEHAIHDFYETLFDQFTNYYNNLSSIRYSLLLSNLVYPSKAK
jgi:hypothetical protein